ncbi:ArsR/SmtB family transcription factor [Desulfitobacterium chlororespirans]|uniref:Transcriptional regulator, ArsR family n=1 Tax=Desulfitobacterium chlororespirans DSM 11544 TaxID=1121395 RepID=A0A1M7URK4_9FIRM|nr:metalloregulator ArsR/SmtB family transcription factor [Desulfitobacterium chlororespirans]SHN85641.1 transcriptional regulator, ArsR family [Desulfitobacterium chlororespirans DSM 11544]
MDDLLKVMKALSDETRLKIINLLLDFDFCVGALSRQLGISEAAVSQHLQILRKAGLVTGEKRGYYTHYDVKRELLEKTAQSLLSIAAHEAPRKDCRLHLTGNHQYCANINPSAKS